MPTDQLVDNLISGLTLGSVYALVGLGFTVIYAVTKIINFAQGEFVMLGGMLSFALADTFGLSLGPALIVSVLVAALVGALVYLFAIRTARNASVISLIIITIGVSIFIRGVAGQTLGKDSVRPPYFTGDESLRFLGAYIQPQALWIIGITLLVMVLVHLFFSYTVVGKAMKASATNSNAASLVGINNRTMALIGFSVAAALGAVAGAVVSPLSTISYTAGVSYGLKGFVAAAIGGFRSQIVTALAGIALGVIESFVIALHWGPFRSAYSDAITLAILLLVLLIRSRKLTEEETAN